MPRHEVNNIITVCFHFGEFFNVNDPFFSVNVCNFSFLAFVGALKLNVTADIYLSRRSLRRPFWRALRGRCISFSNLLKDAHSLIYIWCEKVRQNELFCIFSENWWPLFSFNFVFIYLYGFSLSFLIKWFALIFKIF
jgi:hypothetical protein